MHGEINDRMAEAIESCGVVIVGISSKYKLSANCRMEAEYSNASGKQIIPLMMEQGYRADGWLGLLTAGKLWYGVSYDDEKREENISSMVDVVKSAVLREASAMSPESLFRSASLFDTTIPAATAQEKRPNSTSHNITPEPLPDKCSPMESAAPAVISSNVNSALSLDAVSLIFDQMQVKIQENMSQQLTPIIHSLNNIEQRLRKIENHIDNMQV